ncbi:MAG: HAMP domain-containing sensor histidine kinase [Pseudophaeobacter sp. bin_em_oilr2.035]|uniref:histidine kinase n=1 Tax=Phaeobacter gallaeciensis TaxID=60890 RepID=A0ABD4XAG3_9RHOB|nr:HAMP domain-containing sensor histidine kinase [Phaeobacter gallaeciensis]MDF1771498.1 HAMP domain-containing sensor histidine kinase [Pseudophaeobacter sp. bin_em_oilr2.035]MDE4145435.1 HAMP domain-containing sensor histidine kinase [Phaeobacter gallaeciensis]MDE4158106.1 HAMP domain-containing sensor histidine kinase [Phaeobacter gallaeciensis]MDE4162285.1 HAMP domain-containing sensor histidine kinase [Phaeobacter gallaeciensis]MDE4166511.1 HAMP domain-containing sensor histidine kinase 
MRLRSLLIQGLGQLPGSLAQRLPLLVALSFVAGIVVAGWTSYRIFDRRSALLIAETSGPAMLQILRQASGPDGAASGRLPPYEWQRTPSGFTAEAAHTVPLILILDGHRLRAAAVFDTPPKLPDILGAASEPQSPERRLGDLSRAITRQDSGATLSLFQSDGTVLSIAAPSLWRPRLEETKVALIGLAGFLLGMAAIIPLALNLAAPFRLLARRDPAKLPPLASSEAIQVRDRIDLLKERFAEEQAQKVRGLAAISHDLRTPVTRLRLRSELLEDEELHQRFSADLDEISGIIDGALDLLSIRHQSEQSHQFALASLVESLVDDYRDTGRAVRFLGQPPLRLPGVPTVFGRSAPVDIYTGGQSLMQGQPDKLRRALSNLIDNGLTYGTEVSVSISGAGSEALDVIVEDDGPGIPPDRIAAMLRPFSRGHIGGGGVGLGLAIAQEIAELHNGELFVENTRTGLKATLRLMRGPVLPE